MKVLVPPEYYNVLHQMSSEDLRLPAQMVQWLIRQEALRRGLVSNNGLTQIKVNNGDASVSRAERVAIGS